MVDLEGAWDCITDTPMGKQASVLTFAVDGDRFTGTNSAPMGTLELLDGRIEGDTLHWEMRMTRPMPMLLFCTAQVIGDRLQGTIRAGRMGDFAISAVRR